MSSIQQYIAVKCPDLYADANMNVYIESAQLTIDSEAYGTKYNYAVALRACHDYTITTQQNTVGGGGQILSKKEKNLAVTYSNSSTSVKSGDEYLKLTNFGLELLSIQKGTLNRFGITGSEETEPTYVIL